MPNESLSEREPETNLDKPEPAKPSKLSRIKSTAKSVGIVAIPVALVGGLTYAGWKISLVELETAKINLETAKLVDAASATTPQS